MKTSLDCIPCFVRQTLEAARFTTADASTHERLLRNVLRVVADLDLAQSPPAVAQIIRPGPPSHDGRTRSLRGCQGALQRVCAGTPAGAGAACCSLRGPPGGCRATGHGRQCPFKLDVHGGLTEADALAAVEAAFSQPLLGDLPGFREAVGQAARILYVADNAGEIVFDRLLIGELGAERTTLAVRGAPVLNDATREDAEAARI